MARANYGSINMHYVQPEPQVGDHLRPVPAVTRERFRILRHGPPMLDISPGGGDRIVLGSANPRDYRGVTPEGHPTSNLNIQVVALRNSQPGIHREVPLEFACYEDSSGFTVRTITGWSADYIRSYVGINAADIHPTWFKGFFYITVDRRIMLAHATTPIQVVLANWDRAFMAILRVHPAQPVPKYGDFRIAHWVHPTQPNEEQHCRNITSRAIRMVTSAPSREYLGYIETGLHHIVNGDAGSDLDE